VGIVEQKMKDFFTKTVVKEKINSIYQRKSSMGGGL
jgi:hypothetical protein